MEVGNEIFVDPIPLVEENTSWFAAGALAIGVEPRILDDELLRQEYPQGVPTGATGVSDSGVSLHIVATSDQREYLRFDCFDEQPHYHYLLPDERYQRWVPFDPVSNGPMLDWTIDRLDTRLPEMLAMAGGGELCALVDMEAFRAALRSAEVAARAGSALTVDPHRHL